MYCAAVGAFVRRPCFPNITCLTFHPPLRPCRLLTASSNQILFFPVLEKIHKKKLPMLEETRLSLDVELDEHGT